jgi:hypothetical protein
MPSVPRPSAHENETTGLPLLSTWFRLYIFVLVSFALSVLALLWLSRAFS